MKLSNVKIKVTPEDILNIIEEYVNVEGLIIKEVKLDEIITISGSYKKGVEIPFQASVGFGNIKDNIIYIKIFKFKIYKLGVLKSIKNFALKTFLKDLAEYGVLAQGDNLIVDLNMIVKLIPYVNLELKAISVIDNNLEIEANNVKYEPDKEMPNFKAKKDKDEDKKIKISDRYTKLRVNIEDKVPDKFKDIIEYAMIIPDIAALLWRLFRDKRVNTKTKMLVGGLLAYIASPIDIIPDFIPLIGKIDDVAIVLFAMNKIINEVPEEVILSNWTGKNDVIKIVSEGVTFISKMVGSQNVGKLVETVKKLCVVNKKEENPENVAQNI
ncbi:YkvA family protein [Candidatus Clostridium radicumherbarum]|uniref:YkvA family protein n=1 Tax=Candidatus Clostridium radicumherbarum TaxID=3381662 RepID=A0ABW8TV64_9CLOT